MSLALQAADAIHFLAMNGHIHGNVSAHNISYQGGKATLIDLATLRLIDQVPAGLSKWKLSHKGSHSMFCCSAT